MGKRGRDTSVEGNEIGTLGGGGYFCVELVREKT